MLSSNHIVGFFHYEHAWKDSIDILDFLHRGVLHQIYAKSIGSGVGLRRVENKLESKVKAFQVKERV